MPRSSTSLQPALCKSTPHQTAGEITKYVKRKFMALRPHCCILEGIEDMVDWERIMDARSQDGSFLISSPASAACVFMHTGDIKCFELCNNVLAKFGSFVPCLYPVDLLERLLIVDNLVLLGIDRHFEKEIKEALDYVHRHWNERGIGWGGLNPIVIEITTLGFRLLLLHRYNVTPSLFLITE